MVAANEICKESDMALVAPFPYFGGKRRIAARIWELLGDPGGYVEPFAGSAAVLLARPPVAGRRVETLNDSDGWLVNAWRAIKLDPAAVADHAAGPVTEIDYHARLAWLQERRTDGLVSWLEGDPEAHDPKAAGWWLYVAACGIGDPWGPGPWRVIDGRLVKGNAGRGVNRKLPHLGDAGKGVNRELPHLGNAGRGVNREPSLTSYMTALSERLTRVRITCGSWERVVTPAAIRASSGNKTIAVLLDPPYATGSDLYAATKPTAEVATLAREWAAKHGDRYRIVLCGYEDEHDALLTRGWRKERGKAGRGAGYSTDPLAGRRERLWISPSCLDDAQHALDWESA